MTVALSDLALNVRNQHVPAVVYVPSVVLSHSSVARVAAALILLGAADLGAQAIPQGSIRGIVRDTAGAPIPHADVGLPSLRRHAQTDAAGRFALESVPSGRYILTIAATGYRTARRELDLRAGEAAELAEVLSAGVSVLADVRVSAAAVPDVVRPAPERLGTLITTGARSEIVTLSGSDVNFAEKVPRQIFARVPGLLVYDMDGAGNQTNVSTRGLDPHRSWEFNVRQDGVVINSDLYGYPASHYSPPMEAMEEVQLVRGTAALQYGSQFGGLLSYVTRAPDTTRRLRASGSATAGAFGLVNLIGAAGGRVGRVDYQAYAAGRSTDGYRDGAESEYNAQYVGATWHATRTVRVRAQAGRSWYRHRLPGPLTDAMFHADPRRATRTRNWFSPAIVVPALRLEWTPTESTRGSLQWSGLFGDRSSVLFVGLATTPDVPDPATGVFATRAVDIDNFNSRTVEARLTHGHSVAGRAATLAAGLTLAFNDMRRRQQGPGSRGDGWDLTVTGPFGRDLRYRSRGGGVYAEELLRLTSRWTVVPGMRVEFGSTRMFGQLAYYDPADTPRRVRHDFPLFGVRSTYALAGGAEVYGGWSEAYRPMLLKDLLPENRLERTDPAMRDARGWSGDVGVRGGSGRVTYDIGGFVMRYGDRIGGLLRDDGAGEYLFKTNLGATRTVGIEALIDAILRVTARAT
jgi:Fe(3+) dicitrate transport protein